MRPSNGRIVIHNLIGSFKAIGISHGACLTKHVSTAIAAIVFCQSLALLSSFSKFSVFWGLDLLRAWAAIMSVVMARKLTRSSTLPSRSCWWRMVAQSASALSWIHGSVSLTARFEKKALIAARRLRWHSCSTVPNTMSRWLDTIGFYV